MGLRRSASARWLSVLLWSVGVLVVLLLAAVFGVRSWVNSYLRSTEFRQRLADRSGQHLQARVDIQPIQFGTTQFSCAGLDAAGGRDAKFSRLSIENVRGDFALPSVWRLIAGDRKFEIEDVEIDRLQVDFLPERIPAIFPKPEKKEKITTLRHLAVSEFCANWNGGSIGGLGIVGTPEGRGWQMTGAGGHLNEQGLPPIDIASIRLRYEEPTLFVQEAKLRQGKGELFLTGDATAGEKISLDCKAGGVDVAPFLPEDWRRRLRGSISANFRVRIALSGPLTGTPIITGRAELHDGILEALPILSRLSDFVKTERLRSVKLDEASAEIRMDETGLHISDLIVKSDRLICVRGRYSVVRDEVDGTFEVGIAPGFLEWLPGSQEKVFATLRDDFAWTTLRVTGPAKNPKEDLSLRLMEAAKGAVVGKVGQAATDALGTATQAVGGAVDNVKKSATGVLELLFGN